MTNISLTRGALDRGARRPLDRLTLNLTFDL